jgi:hypothetical protein
MEVVWLTVIPPCLMIELTLQFQSPRLLLLACPERSWEGGINSEV